MITAVPGGMGPFIAASSAPLVAREVALSDAGAELAAMNGPMPPGTAVITDFSA